MITPKLMRTPRSLDLEITSHCDAACRYCYYLNNPEVEYTDQPKSVWLGFFEELGRCQVMHVTLQGGEPLLRDDIYELIDGIVSNQMRFSILSSGRRLTADVARRLKSTGRCEQVQISLDGSCAEVHESQRGADTFAPALTAVRTLLDVGVPVTVRVTIHPGNLTDLPRLAEMLLERLGLPSFSTNSSAPLGNAEKYTSSIFLNTHQRLAAMKTLADLEQIYPGRIQSSAGPLADWHMFNSMEMARRNNEVIPGHGQLTGCGCVFSKLAVRSDGAIIPCVMLPHFVLGHIKHNDLAEVWQTAPMLVHLRRRRDIKLETFKECAACDWRDTCTGNCPGTAWTITGTVDQPCPFSCLKRFYDDLEKHGKTLWP